jgi:hypothetical protein
MALRAPRAFRRLDRSVKTRRVEPRRVCSPIDATSRKMLEIAASLRVSGVSMAGSSLE